jgi:hypothetical protein
MASVVLQVRLAVVVAWLAQAIHLTRVALHTFLEARGWKAGGLIGVDMGCRQQAVRH